jgi:hypothetical protein
MNNEIAYILLCSSMLGLLKRLEHMKGRRDQNLFLQPLDLSGYLVLVLVLVLVFSI